MIKSMTGYGRVQSIVSGYEITVELRSVNHRYFEFYPRIPRVYGYLEDALRQCVQAQISRGKLDIFVGIAAADIADSHVEVNTALATSYLEELRQLGRTLALKDTLTLADMTRFHDIFKIEATEEKEDVIWQAVEPALQEALAQLLAMRTVEGAQTKKDILGRLATVEEHLTQIESHAPETVATYRQRLFEKLQELLGDHQVEEQRLLTEVAIFADRTAVDEETVRLRSHISQMYSILDEDQPVGRKLDFLVQEFNREVNTIGAKSQNLTVNHIVVEMKSEIEKIREQVQNIE